MKIKNRTFFADLFKVKIFSLGLVIVLIRIQSQLFHAIMKIVLHNII